MAVPKKEKPPVGIVRRILRVFVLLGGLFVLAGILIALPSLRSGGDRGKAKRTMADMRSLSIAIEAYRDERGSYPDATAIDELAPQIEPAFLRRAPRRDGWGAAFEVRSGGGGFTIRSTGGEGARPIVLENGDFTRLPE